VRIDTCAICHSDIHLIRGEWGGRPPLVAGHEASGIVEEVGEGVTSVKPGDHVVVSLLRSCGSCFHCATGSAFICDGPFALDQGTRLHSRDGVPIAQAISTGAFAEEVIVDQSQLVVVPDDLPLDRAALLACGVITGVGAVINTAGVRPGESVAIIGAGGVGLNAIQGARLAGAATIVAIDVRESKAPAAMQFGATHFVDARQADAVEMVRVLSGGRGVDHAILTVGNAEAAAQGLALVRHGGTLTLVGMPSIDATMPLNIWEVVARSQRIIGSSMGSTLLRIDVPRLVELYRQGRIRLDELITNRFPLDRINEAIESTERGEALRNVVVMR
jgi:S-(hydroxymethyl)glutathione dehydrogenase / alcohol dehydrogenase